MPGEGRGTSLRTALSTITLLLTALVVATAVAMAVTTTALHRSFDRLAHAGEGVRAAQDVKIALLRIERASLLLAHTGLEEHRLHQDQQRRRLDASLERARTYHQGSGTYAALWEEVHRYHAERERVEETIADATERYDAMSERVTSALDAAAAFVALQRERAEAESRIAERWNYLADALAVSLALLLPLAAIFVLVRARRALRAFEVVRQAIVGYGQGDEGRRAPVTGPAELHDIADHFNQMADRLGRQKEAQLRFLAGVAHDLRNPLAALKAALGVTAREARPSAERLQRTLVLTERQVGRLERMVEDLLDSARAEAGRLVLRVEECDLARLVRDTAELFQNVSPHHVIELKLPDAPVVARGDQVRLEQVLNNLVSNAIKYSPEGGTVKIWLERRGDRAIVRVLDQGVGLSREQIEGLFRPFVRAALGDSIPGVGLGLWVSRRLVEAHGGSISVESSRDEGSCFTVELPLSGPPQAAPG